jgi:hypothetical protein
MIAASLQDELRVVLIKCPSCKERRHANHPDQDWSNASVSSLFNN